MDPSEGAEVLPRRLTGKKRGLGVEPAAKRGSPVKAVGENRVGVRRTGRAPKRAGEGEDLRLLPTRGDAGEGDKMEAVLRTAKGRFHLDLGARQRGADLIRHGVRGAVLGKDKFHDHGIIARLKRVPAQGFKSLLHDNALQMKNRNTSYYCSRKAP